MRLFSAEERAEDGGEYREDVGGWNVSEPFLLEKVIESQRVLK